MKRIVISKEAKADICAIPQQADMNILIAIHRLAESGVGRVKTLHDEDSDYRVRFTKEHPDTLRIHAVRNRKDAYR